MRFIETPAFTDSLLKTLSDEEYRSLQIALMLRPTVGPAIRGSGRLRKARWGAAGESGAVFASSTTGMSRVTRSTFF